MLKQSIILVITALSVAGCDWKGTGGTEGLSDSFETVDTFQAKKIDSLMQHDSTRRKEPDNVINKDTGFIAPAKTIDVGYTKPEDVVAFAKTLIGVPYVWGSTNPRVGFDCSGFITHVFNHFRIAVPRSSIDFTNVGKQVTVEEAKLGDLILFTGTNPLERHVGHMGIITENNNGQLNFIHSTSGKAMGVTITPFSDYYKTRFVKVIRVFP